MKKLFTNLTLWSLTLGHFCIDLLSGGLPIVMVFVSSALGLNIAQVGAILGMYALSTSLTQPFFGLLADRYGGRWFSVGGLLWMASFYALIGFMPTFEGVVLVTAIGGLGSAAFHPQGASGANVAAGDRKTAGVALFMLGGNGGYALGPIVAATALGVFGVHGTAAMSAIALLLSVLLFAVTRRSPKGPKIVHTGSLWKISINPTYSRLAILALIAVMSLRAWSQSSFTAFLPQYYISQAGFTVAQASALSSTMLFMLAFGSLFGGFGADRVGAWRVMVVSLVLSAPLMALMFYVKDEKAYVLALMLGFAAGSAWPPMLVMAQELFPKNAGVGSGIALGFVFAVGGLGTAITGWVAEQQGINAAMALLCSLPLIAAVCSFALPNRKSRPKPDKPIAQDALGPSVSAPKPS